MEQIDFDDIDVEDRLLNALRADNPGSKLKRIINNHREDATKTIYKRWDTQKTIEKIQIDLDKEIEILKELENNENENEDEDYIEKKLSTQYLIQKLRYRIKEKRENQITFNSYAMDKNGRLLEEIGDDKLIKRSLANWRQLRTPAYYKQNSLFIIMKNYTDERILHKINDIRNNEETTYQKFCNTCLLEEDGIIHKLIECAPILYINETICKAVTEYTGISITSKSKQRKPDDLRRFILFLDTPSAVRKQSNKETEKITKALSAIASIATATSRKIWLQNHIRKPNTEQTQSIVRQTMETIRQCYDSKPEINIIQDIMRIIISIFDEDRKSKLQINYSAPSEYDRIRVEKTQIPIFIYEEAQGDAFARLLMLHQERMDTGLPLLRETIDNLFLLVNNLTRKDQIIKRLATRRICAILVTIASKRINLTVKRTAEWYKYERDLCKDINKMKNQLPRKPDEEEFKELWNEATLAYQTINAFNTPNESETQNVESYCRMNYRRQLRASHLKIIDKMKKYNQILKNISLQTLEY